MRNILLGMVGLCISVSVCAQTSEVRDITPLGFSGDFIAVEYSSTRGLIAVGDNGCLYISSDTAKTWEVEKTPIYINHIVFHEDNLNGYTVNNNGVYKTINGAISWSKMELDGVPSQINFLDVSIKRIYIKNDSTLFLVVGNGEHRLFLYKSDNAGISWEQVADDLYSDSPYINTTTMHWQNDEHGFIYGMGYYLETIDSGTSWNKTLFLDFTEVITHVYSYFGGQSIMYHTKTNSGDASILSRTIDGNPENREYKNNISSEISAFAAFDETVYGIGRNGFLYKSVDSAKTWSENHILGNTNYLKLTGMYFFDENNGVVVGKNLTSYLTTDAGETWTKYVHGAAEGMEQIYCKNTEECFITGSKGRLFRTQDGGETWTWEDIHTNILHEIEFPTQDTGYIVGDKVLFMTIDGGETWNKKITDKTNSSLIEFTTSNSGYLGYDGTKSTIEKTIDAGDTWTEPIDANYFYNSKYNRKFSFRDINEGVVCGSDNLLIHTVDGGINWELIDSIPSNYTYMYDIVSVSDKGWLVQALEYSVTTDLFYCDNEFNCQIVFPGNGQGFVNLQQINDSTYAISHDTLEYISTDYGLTWNELEVMIPGKIDFVDVHHAFSMSSYNISKAYWGLQEISVSVTQNNNRNYTLTPIFSDNTLEATLYVKDSEGSLHEVVPHVTLQSGVGYILEISQEIQSGSYRIYIEPQSSAYEPVESEEITIDNDTGLYNWSSSEVEKSCYTLEGNILYIITENVRVFNVMGIEIPITNTDIQLNAGVYIIETECGTNKIMVND